MPRTTAAASLDGRRALMLVKIEVRFGRAAEYDGDVASHLRRVSNPLEFAFLHHALLALVLDAVLVLAVAAVWKLAHYLVWTIGGVAVRKTGAQPDPLSEPVSVSHGTSRRLRELRRRRHLEAKGSPKRNEIAAPACQTTNRRGAVIVAERRRPPRRLRKKWQRGDFTPHAFVLVPRSTLVLNERATLVLDNLSGLRRDGCHSCQRDESGERYFHIAQHNHLSKRKRNVSPLQLQHYILLVKARTASTRLNRV